MPNKNPFYSENDLSFETNKQIKEQDEILDDIDKVVKKLKYNAIEIGIELETQDDLLENLTHNVDKSNSKLNKANRLVTMVSKTLETCGFLGCIICTLLFFISIFLIIIFSTQ